MSWFKDFIPDFSYLEGENEAIKEQRAKKEAQHHARTELKPSLSGVSNLNIGFKTIPVPKLNTHMAFQGATRSGKSQLNNILLKSVMEAHSVPRNIVVLDSKGDNIQWSKPLAERLGLPHRILRIDHPESYCLDVARMVAGNKFYMREFAKILVPTPKHGERFWALTVQAVLMRVMMALEETKPGRWGFHDLYDNCLVELPELLEFMSVTEEGKAIVKRFFPKDKGLDTQYGILAELTTTVDELAPAAELQRRTPRERWITTAEMIGDKSCITLISEANRLKRAFNPLVRFLFYVLTEEIADLPEPLTDAERKLIWLSIDELPHWGNLSGIDEMLQFNPSKGLRAAITFQDIGKIQDIYGRNRANAIVGNALIKVFLTAASGESADWAVNQLGKRRVIEELISYSSSGTTVSEQAVLKAPITSGNLIDLPIADIDDGIYFYMNTPSNYGGLYKMFVDAATVGEFQPVVRRERGEAERLARYPERDETEPLFLLLDHLEDDKGREDYLSSCSTPLERTTGETVWDLTQELMDTLVRRLFERYRRRRGEA